MDELERTSGDTLPPKPIRVETALSRYPVHRLAKHGEIAIDIREKNADGEVSIKWEVTHNSKYGQPGPLAYKLDTLIINRRIEETGRPIPKVIRLGSLRAIAEELGISTHATDTIRKALRQNAGALISTRTRYRKTDGTELTLEADFTRYSVVFTGEELPNGRKAGAIHIILNDIYMQVINGAVTRPLDYDYLKGLPPASQRFYELLSYHMYSAMKYGRPRARLIYSELCRYAPLTRHLEWDQVRKQLAKVHAPHTKSGYVARIEFQETVDIDGYADWSISYQPGPKARAEFAAFARRGGPVTLEMEPFEDGAASMPLFDRPEPSPLELELVGHGVTRAVAAELVRDYDAERIREQMEILAWHHEKKPGKINEPGAWLVIAVKNGHARPKGFVSLAERQEREEVQRKAERAKVEARRREREQEAREAREREAAKAYWESLTAEEQAGLQEIMDAEAGPEALASERGPLRESFRRLWREEYLCRMLRGRGEEAGEG